MLARSVLANGSKCDFCCIDQVKIERGGLRGGIGRYSREKLAGALYIELEFFGRSGAKRRSYTPISLLLLLLLYCYYYYYLLRGYKIVIIIKMSIGNRTQRSTIQGVVGPVN